MGCRSKCKSENYNVYRRKHIGESLRDPGTQRFLRTQSMHKGKKNEVHFYECIQQHYS